jgi:hypothetical protein
MNSSEADSTPALAKYWSWSAVPLNPSALILFASAMYVFALDAGPRWSMTSGFHWYVTTDQSHIVLLGILALLTGLGLAQLTGKKSRTIAPYDVASLVAKGRFLCYISISAYLVWFAVSSDEWLHPNTYGHVTTVPGITTLTQVLPLGLSCLFIGHKCGYAKPQDRWIFIGTFIFTIERVLVNHERLAFAETYFPLIILYLVFSPRPQGFRMFGRLMILPGLAFGALILFAVLEYFRSWAFYSSFYSGSYSSFALQRIQNYYVSALNNGAIYDTYGEPGRLVMLKTLDLIWQFPIIGQYLAQTLSSASHFDWASLLISASGTDEFNNPSALLPLSSEDTRFGMFLILGILAYLMGRLHSRMRQGDVFSVIAYSSLALGLFELPLIFWFSLGKTLPVYIALFWLSRPSKTQSTINVKVSKPSASINRFLSEKYH